MSWLRSTELRGVAFAVALALLAPAALGQDAPPKAATEKGMSGGCEAFKWPLDKERAAFDAAALEKAASGAARGPLKEQAFALALVPAKDVSFTVPTAPAPAITLVGEIVSAERVSGFTVSRAVLLTLL